MIRGILVVICKVVTTQLSVIHTQIIGWREPSLRMLLYMSNAPFHLAGDGKVSCDYIHVCIAMSIREPVDSLCRNCANTPVA